MSRDITMITFEQSKFAMLSVLPLLFIIGHCQSQGSGGSDGPCPDCLNAPYFTCWEQNKYTYAGYHDPEYMNNADYPQYTQGDVCDHTDPNSGEIRNICRFQVHKNDCSNPDAQYQQYEGTDCDKTWGWKCSHDSECPEGWMDSSDGCVEVGSNMIVCCCRGDFCNGEQFMQYSIQGWTDPNMACNVINGKCEGSGGSGGGGGRRTGGGGKRGGRAMSDIMGYMYDDDGNSNVDKNNYVNMKAVLVIFCFFMVGGLFCFIGIYIGQKLNVSRDIMVKNSDI